MADSGIPYELDTPGGVVKFNEWIRLTDEETGRVNLMPSPNGVNGWKSFVVAGTGVDRPLRVLRTDSTWTAVLTDPTQRAALERTFDRMVVTTLADFSGDVPLWVYCNLHDGPLGFTLKDSDNAPLYVPKPTTSGPYTRATVDLSSQAYRLGWIARAKTLIDAGAAGLWIDDVGLDAALSAVRSGGAAPLRDMTWWTEAVTNFVEQIATELRAYAPDVELVHNSPWYAGRPNRWLLPPNATKQVNHGFDLTTENWVTDATGVVTWVAAGGRTSPGCLQVDTTAANQGVRSYDFPATVGNLQSVSVWVKAPAGKSVVVGIGEKSSGGTMLRETSSTVTPGTGTWQRLTVTKQLGASAANWYAYVRVTTAGAATIFVDDAAISNGGYALDVTESTPTANPVRRQIAAADYINVEGGFTDPVLTSGPAETVAQSANQWSLRSLFSFIDAVHSLGRRVIVEQWNDDDAQRAYTLALWLYACQAGDGIGLQSERPAWPNVWEQWLYRWGARTARSDDGTSISSTLMFGQASASPVIFSSGSAVRTSAPYAVPGTISTLQPVTDADFQNAGSRATPVNTGYWALLATTPHALTTTVADVQEGDVFGVRVKLRVDTRVDGDTPFTLRAYTTGSTRDPYPTDIYEVQSELPAREYPAGSIVTLEERFTITEDQLLAAVFPGSTTFPGSNLYPGTSAVVTAAEDLELGLQLSVDALTTTSGVLTVGEVLVTKLDSIDQQLPEYGDGNSLGWRWDGAVGSSVSRQYTWEYVPGVLQLQAVSGMEPVIRKTTKNRPQRHGITVGRGRLGGMTPSFQGQFVHDGPATQESLRRQLYGALYSLVDDWGTLYWDPADSNERRSMSVTLMEKPDVSGDLFKTFQFMLVSDRPFIHGEKLNTQYTAYLSDSLGGGLVFPLTFPIDFVDPGLAGASTITNHGENITYPTITIYGPLSNFTVRNYTTGAQLRTAGVTVAAGDTAVIDMWDETIYKNGDPTQPLMQYLDTVQSEFWEMQPGDNLIGITGSGSDPAKTRARIDWWDSYV